MRPAPGIAVAAIALGLAAGACSEPGPAAPGAKWVSLTRLAEGVHAVEVWARAGDDRLALAAMPGEPLAVGPLPASSGCRLRTGLAAADATTEVSVRVALRSPDREAELLRTTLRLEPGGWSAGMRG